MTTRHAVYRGVGCAGAGCVVAIGALAVLGAVLAPRAVPDAPAPALSSATPVGPVTAARTVTSGAVDWHFAPGIAPEDRAALIEAGAADVAHVEQSFARRFPAPPRVFALDSEQSFAASLSDLFGLDRARAAEMAHRYAGYTGTHARSGAEVTAIDWSRLAKERPLFRLRHELSHVMIHQLTAPSRELPSWLDEGLAEMEAQTVPGLSWTLAQSRYFAASMAATDTLVPLDRLTTRDQAYAVLAEQIANATECTRLLEADVGRGGILRILGELSRGRRFDEAFRAAAGVPFARFAATTADRLRALAPSYPGIATAPDGPSGPGPTYVLYGFPPGSPVNVVVHGNGLSAKETRTMSAHGYSAGVLTSAWPSGTYEISAVGANGSARATATRAAAR